MTKRVHKINMAHAQQLASKSCAISLSQTDGTALLAVLPAGAHVIVSVLKEDSKNHNNRHDEKTINTVRRRASNLLSILDAPVSMILSTNQSEGLH
jgi:riboflavin synthase